MARPQSVLCSEILLYIDLLEVIVLKYKTTYEPQLKSMHLGNVDELNIISICV